MPLTYTDKDGVEYIHTSVMVPRRLRDMARERNISISRCLRCALEEKLRESVEGKAGQNSRTHGTSLE